MKLAHKLTCSAHSRLPAKLCISLLCCSLLFAVSTNAEPQFKLDLGKAFQTLKSTKSAIVQLSEEEEIALGQGVTSNLMSLAPLVADQDVQAYVNRVGRWISMHSERPDLPWTFAVLDHNDINAFAAPGGYIVLTKGMLLKLRSEAELAGVLAHEIAHIVRKHHLNAIQSGNAKLAAKEGLSMLMDAKGKTDQNVLKAISAGTEIFGKGLDKEDEFESDRVGVVLAARSGYDPFGLPAALQTLQGITSDSSAFQLMLETHPKPSDRLAQLDRIMNRDFDRYDSAPNVQKRFEQIIGRLRSSK